ncbi:sulfatase-like hydrolase/transferase [Mucisphaera calidilacus]|nr:sulfatase-like hydrolase/transferase [Mucisphaera calidilacus]
MNIVLIHSDQHRYDCVGAHGHGLLQTPGMDRLCREGVDFSHAFTPAPICSPARGCLITGQWPTQHGCMSIPPTEIYRPIDKPEGPLMPKLLVEAGYSTAHIGKWHGETPGEPDSWGMEEYIPEERGYDAWRAEQGLPERVRKNGWFGEIDEAITPEQHRVAWGGRHAVRCIEKFSERDAPFFVRWDPSEPHLPNMIPPAMKDLYPPEKIEPWPSFADGLAGKPWVQGRQQRIWGVDGWSWEHWAPVVSRYLADITLLDRQVEMILETLDRLGLAENTVVVYSTDHGDLCGGHGMMDKHFMMYDDVLRVPMMMRWPGVTEPGRVCDAFVHHELDLATSLLVAAGIDVPEHYEGVDLSKLLRGEVAEREMAFSQYQGCQFGLYSERMARDKRWKYVWNATAQDEFYDLDADPGELVNRIDDASCAEPLRRLRAGMGSWMSSIGDPLHNEFTRVIWE